MLVEVIPELFNYL